MTTMRLLPKALLLLSFSACGTHSAIEASREFSRLGDFERAWEILDKARNDEIVAGDTPSPELEDAHHTARVNRLVSRARQNTTTRPCGS
jgi:hypothetical protein